MEFLALQIKLFFRDEKRVDSYKHFVFKIHLLKLTNLKCDFCVAFLEVLSIPLISEGQPLFIT